MGSTLSETTLEGATVSEATQSEVKSRKKRFVSLLPLLAVLLMKRPQRESEKTQMDMQSVLTTLLPLSIPFIPSDASIDHIDHASMLPVLKELASEEKMVSGIAKRDQPSESKTETDSTSQSQNVRQKRAIVSHEKVKENPNAILSASFEWLNNYFKAMQEVKKVILSKSDVKNPSSFEEWTQAATEYLVKYQNENPLLVLCHVAGCSNVDITDLSGNPGDQILLEFSQGDTRSKYLSQGLLRMFGPDFIKRPDVSEWLNKEILADFKQFVTDKYSA